MTARRVCLLLAVLCLVIAFGVIWLELQPHPFAVADMTGVLSAIVTLPTCFVLNAIAARTIGLRAGDSHAAFATIMGAAALVNAGALAALGAWITRTQKH